MNNNNKTLEELEEDYWPALPSYPTGLVKTVFELCKKSLSAMDSNDLRMLITQSVGLKYIIPKAISILSQNILEEALYYPGDLLLAVLNTGNKYWQENFDAKNKFYSILQNSISNIKISDCIIEETRDTLLNAINKFILLE